MKNKFINKMLIITIVLVLSVSGCTRNERIKPEVRKINSMEDYVSITKKQKKFDEITGIDEIAVVVEGIEVTKREIETQKLNLKNETVKGAVDLLIWQKSAEAEANKLNISPPQEKLDLYLEQLQASLDKTSPNYELTFKMLEIAGLSEEEYIEKSMEAIYPIYQREALWEYVSRSEGLTDYDKYFDELMKNATVEFKDKEINRQYLSKE